MTLSKQEFEEVLNAMCSRVTIDWSDKSQLKDKIKQLILDLIGERERDSELCGEIMDCNYCASEICEIEIRNELRKELRAIVEGK